MNEWMNIVQHFLFYSRGLKMSTKNVYKIKVFIEKTKTDKQLFLAIISANGVKANQYSKALVDGIVTLDDLFKDIP